MSKPEKGSSLYRLRHSAAHVLAQAIMRLFRDVKLAIGPVTEYGFFYDLTTEAPITESDLPRIEEEMRNIIAQKYSISGRRVAKAEALEIYKNNQFKTDIINRIEDEEVSIYSQGEFFDLCHGNHTDTTGAVKFFKLMGVSGSYWKGAKENVQLQRISGVCFETESQLKEHLEFLELAKKNDHRVLGKDLNLFFFSEHSPGMVFFKPKGTIVFNLLVDLVRKIQTKFGFVEIKSPLVLKEDMWHTSGHYENYKENMFFSNAGDEKFCIRPMNCPCAVLTFKNDFYSYNNLPLRMAEFGLVHRYELSGALHGLSRVRSFTQDDAHTFCTEDQIESEVIRDMELAKEIYSYFKFKSVKYLISTKPEKSIGDDASWDLATNALKNALEKLGLPFEVCEGEGAFYGPKIELQIKDFIGRWWTCATVQIDFFLPQRFELEYVDADQSRKAPIMIHRAILGSIERFFSIILEDYQGWLPFWLAPVQFSILTISEKQKDFATSLCSQMQELGLRPEVDASSETISSKIRKSVGQKIPFALVIGAKEVENNVVTIRLPDGKQIQNVGLERLEALRSIRASSELISLFS